ncbi:D-hexose-6-phosphate mutarotase [Schaalia canis]|uniref:Putative glucose-6-phosphate 1-epimerase n=1 Tax=Schaalia canis TaxID=100469 RepID=A0A3P1SDX5_9ACTO|nr:D-hexose-6-phosphate mutarotase [Schaalia canis]RRC95501.1 D-hexose-6-phosphate mutarotase [Schaalia canis]
MSHSSIQSVQTPDSTLVVRDFGAQVLSWRPRASEEVLWVSPLATITRASPLRGGIPVCFPWFDNASRSSAVEATQAPTHGFARNTLWERKKSTEGDSLCFSLTHAPFASGQLEATTRELAEAEYWDLYPHSFDADLSVRTRETLEITLTVTNTDNHSYVFEAAFHTYFRVSDIRNINLKGLEGACYIDALNGFTAGVGDSLDTFSEAVDRVYTSKSPVTISDPGLSREIHIATEGFGSWIVWTPWSEGALSIEDIPDEAWADFLCLEAGNVLGDAQQIYPGETLEMTMRVSVSDLTSFPPQS